jgi:ABC-type transport system involved in multi-copper enzyme maturation permease subunit
MADLRNTSGRLDLGGDWRPIGFYAGVLAAIAAGAAAAGWLLDAQAAPSVATGVRLAGLVAAIGWTFYGVSTLLSDGTRPLKRSADLGPATRGLALTAILAGGSGLAEMAARQLSLPLGVVLQLAAAAGPGLLLWRAFKAAPQHRRLAAAVGGLIGTGALVWFLARQGLDAAAITIAAVVAITSAFLIGLAALRAILAGPGWAAVARTVVDEAIRMRAALVLLIVLVLSLPLLPLLLDSGERLEYRVQFLLTWALGTTTLLLGLLNVFLGCGSLSGDIDSSRIHMTLTKPLGRPEYLIGKWAGLVAVDALLVVIAGIGIYAFTRALALSEATSQGDRYAVDERVLTARQSVRPTHPSGDAYAREVEKVIDDFEKEVPDAFQKDRQATRQTIREQYVRKWHTVFPDKVSEYVFSGLTQAKKTSPIVQLRVRPYGEGAGLDRADVRFALWVNGRPYPYRDGEHLPYTLAGQTTHTIDIPTEAIDDKGVLRLTIENKNLVLPGATRPTTIGLVPGKGLEVLEPVGSFGQNYLKCVFVVWLKLAMIAAVAVASATFLGFPMAVLLSLMVFLSAFGSGFVGDSLELYTGMDDAEATIRDMAQLRYASFYDFLKRGEYWEAVKVIMAIVGEVFVKIIPSFDRYDTVTAVASGMNVSAWTVAECILRVGIMAPIVLGLVAWFCFERRDLVRANT